MTNIYLSVNMSDNGRSNIKSISFSSRNTKKYSMNKITLALTIWGSYHGLYCGLLPNRECSAFQSYAGLVVYLIGLFKSTSIWSLLLPYFLLHIDDNCVLFALKIR